MASPIGLTIKSKLEDMQIGDVIPCRYTATSGQAGYFSELGTCIANEIPITGTATPNGLFYFIKVDKGTLIADRVLQTSISWDVLNTGKYIEGKFNDFKDLIPQTMSGYSTPIPLVVTESTHYNSFYGWYPFNKGPLIDNTAVNVWDVYNTIQPLISKTGINKSSHWLKIDLGTVKAMNLLDLSAFQESTGFYSIKDFEVYTSNDDTTYTQVLSATHPNDVLWHTYNLNPSTGRYVMFLIKNSYYDTSGKTVGIQKVSLYDNNQPESILRSLSGGVAYSDANGNLSTSDKGKGAFPTNNEWDKYIVNSDLNGKITPGDDNIWHYISNSNTWCKETPITSISSSATRVFRGTSSSSYDQKRYFASSNSNSVGSIGFRPILEYLELNSKATSLYY